MADVSKEPQIATSSFAASTAIRLAVSWTAATYGMRFKVCCKVLGRERRNELTIHAAGTPLSPMPCTVAVASWK